MEFAFFFEVLVGGLLAGVMYSLVALGFVLIYKASGVFNFAQGAMVFFAALTFVCLRRARASTSGWRSLLTLAVMVVLGLVDRAGRAAAARQPAADHAVHGDDRPHVRLEGLAQLVWGSQPHGLELGIQDVPIEWLSQTDRTSTSASSTSFAAGVAGDPGRRARAVLPEDADRPRAARGRRRPPGRARGRHSAAADLGHRLGGRRLRRAGRRPAVGRAQRRAVRADVRRAEGAAGADPRRLRVGPRRDRRRPDHRRRRRSSPRSTSARIVGGGIEGWFPYVLALLFLLVRPRGAVRREASSRGS